MLQRHPLSAAYDRPAKPAEARSGARAKAGGGEWESDPPVPRPRDTTVLRSAFQPPLSSTPCSAPGTVHAGDTVRGSHRGSQSGGEETADGRTLVNQEHLQQRPQDQRKDVSAWINRRFAGRAALVQVSLLQAPPGCNGGRRRRKMTGAKPARSRAGVGGVWTSTHSWQPPLASQDYCAPRLRVEGQAMGPPLQHLQPPACSRRPPNPTGQGTAPPRIPWPPPLLCRSRSGRRPAKRHDHPARTIQGTGG